MIDTTDPQRLHRAAPLWYAYVMLGIVTYFMNIQGNIVPFLKAELDLSYRIVSLHPSAMAGGMFLIGFFSDRVMARFGRRRTNWIGMAGICVGALMICVATNVWVSLPGFALIGLFGSLLPTVSVAVIADTPLRWRTQAFAESNAMAYVFATMAPLLTGLSVYLALDWRSPLIAGIAAGLIVIFLHRRTALAERPAYHGAAPAALPAAYWAYWVLLMLGVAMEFAVVIWSPEFLERVVGLSRGGAATGAAAFFVAVLIGRIAGSRLVRTIPTRTLYLAALALTFIGFLIYWGVEGPVAAIVGLFVLGLGIAQYYPLTVAFAVHAAGAAAEKGSARFMSAVGLAIIVTPAIMGVLADSYGLRLAHLVLPVLVTAGLGCFLLAQNLERRRVAAA